ncbi:nicotinate-nucleotide--dimethylbenzimidazole phosphoribosyltransferase [Roseobacter sp.]|uniref:nicotinate-nucleotide--dimethylbenzimidazole phosphoribosyltransferase n=1 Tax=Roseobacter sp. TaxID=1907202 RepID=UPI0032993D4A
MTAAFSDMGGVRVLLASQPAQDAVAVSAAKARNEQLTKPPGALGRLEDLAIWYAGWRGTDRPAICAPQVIVFAGNHGVAAQGVSAFPPEVTEQMVLNFQQGGAAINQLARTFGAKLDVHALSLDRPTADFTQSPAMSEADFIEALHAGWAAVDDSTDVLITGEMGIGNTTSAAALACALLGGEAADWTGRGTGVDDAGLATKTRVVAQGVAMHGGQGDGLDMLRRLGGREMAAMAGAMIRARQLRIPVMLDGFICTAAALALAKTQPGALDHCMAGHLSAEGAHGRVLEAIDKAPLVSLGLRLGEASGAALSLGVLQGAVACLSGMATFAEAGVSGS